MREVAEEELVVALMSLQVQGKCLSWETAMSMDMSWNKLLYVWTPTLLNFYNNAMCDTLPSPANLKLWKKTDIGKCDLCSHNNGSMDHILCWCKRSLNEGRYNWRHDMVLRVMIKWFMIAIKKPTVSIGIKEVKFVSNKGVKYKSATKPMLEQKKENGKMDWRICWDEDGKVAPFPQHITTINLRPDIVIYSDSKKEVVLCELTIPSEERFDDAVERKEKRYEKLIADCKKNGWMSSLYTFEVGVRGICHDTCHRLMKRFGATGKKTKDVTNKMGMVALQASYNIWLHRSIPQLNKWDITPVPKSEIR